MLYLYIFHILNVMELTNLNTEISKKMHNYNVHKCKACFLLKIWVL